MSGIATQPGDRQSPSFDRAVWVLTALVLLFGLVRASQLAWLCDDAFISLRYAQHLVDGHGLVYNPGERVEGYTNFLWTLMLAGAMAAGIPALASAKILGVLSYATLALALIAASWRRSGRRRAPFLPLAGGVILISLDFHEWASGGLETAFFSALAFGGTLLATRHQNTERSDIVAGVLFSALVLTRLDGGLFVAGSLLGLWFINDAKGALRRSLRIGTPVALTLVIFGAWKLSYYGELLPTAFYSKSVLDPYFTQGIRYLTLYLQKNWILLIALLGVPIWRAMFREETDGEDRRALVLLSTATLYVAYVVTTGGDFMFARRLIPAVPLIWFAVEIWLPRSVSLSSRAVVTAACVLAAAAPYPVFGNAPRISGIADERRFYPPAAVEKRRLQAEFVGASLLGTNARVMFEGGMCMFGFYSGLPYLVELTGLTQYSLARLPLEDRGWIGHEKQATEAWTTENGIQLVMSHAYPPITQPQQPPVDHLYFGDLAVARIHQYDDALMNHLAEIEGVTFMPIEQVIEKKRREIERAQRTRAEEIYAWINRYYLSTAGKRGQNIAADLRAIVDAKTL